ncbi:MAG: malto-oligosyltrehalose synthase [Myxococcota bacterium]
MEEAVARSPFTPPLGSPPAAVQELEAEEIFEAVAARFSSGTLHTPLATYRLQLNGAFTFRDAMALTGYLDALGITDVYSSPFFRARTGSTHGYDLVDHNSINPAIGTREDLEAWRHALRERGLGLVLDFVPNHMGINTAENPWWMDVLENGPSSLYAPVFDIDWTPLKSELRHKVLLPVLGEHYGRVLENGELRLHLEQGAFQVRYWSTTFPVNPRTYPLILEPLLPSLMEQLGVEHDAVLELQSIITGLRHLPPRTETLRAKVMERRREKEILKRRLATLIAESPDVRDAVQQRLVVLNGQKGWPRSFDELDALLEEQAYRLSYWRVAGEEINYRRFFDINDLAAIHMENPVVFEQAHALLLNLLADDVVTGLRIDHPDGLWDPRGYFTALQEQFFLELCRREHARRHHSNGDVRTRERFASLVPRLTHLLAEAVAALPKGGLARPLYVVGEKILSRGEKLPGDWPLHGTSGYEFAAKLAGVFVDGTSEHRMTDIYERFTGLRTDFETLVYEKKKLILRTSLVSELNVLAHALNRLSERDRHSRDFTLGSLTEALREVIACFPVYRTYVNEREEVVTEQDRMVIARAVRLARRRDPTTDASVYAFIRAVLTLELPDTVPDGDRHLWREFVMRFQQLTGPVMAKGLEDTAFYAYNRLVSLNEVGGEPERYGINVAELHRANAERQRDWPSSMLSLSTHDTKRSEDVRARISVLSELPDQWAAALAELSRAAEAHKVDVDGQLAPDRNEEYLLYQTLLGSWPFEEPVGEARKAYEERLVAYMRKATKEAKVNTSWINANPEYDAAVEGFVRAVVGRDDVLGEAFHDLARVVAFHGMWSSLSKSLLKFTSPGVPDTYQGTEMWDLSLVDPDNRRPVDWALRQRALNGILDRKANARDLCRELMRHATDGRIKLYVAYTALRTRRRLPDLFGPLGAYVPLSALGAQPDHVVAFSRRHGEHELVVLVPRLTAVLAGGRMEAPVGPVWTDTWLPLAEGRFTNLFTGEPLSTRDREGISALDLDQVLADFPVALLERVIPDGR